MGITATRTLKFSLYFAARNSRLGLGLEVWLEAGIAAAGNGGLHTGLRVTGAAKKIFYFFQKNVTLFKKLSILYM